MEAVPVQGPALGETIVATCNVGRVQGFSSKVVNLISPIDSSSGAWCQAFSMSFLPHFELLSILLPQCLRGLLPTYSPSSMVCWIEAGLWQWGVLQEAGA